MSKKKRKSVHKEKRHQLANRSPEEIRAEKVKKCFKRNKQTVRDELIYDKIFFEGLDYDFVRQTRRTKAIVDTYPRVMDLVSDVVQEHSELFTVESDWIELNTAALAGYDYQEMDYHAALAAATWILDQVKKAGKIEELKSTIGVDPEGSLPPQPFVCDPCHDISIRNAMMIAIYMRNGNTKLYDESRKRQLIRLYMDPALAEGTVDRTAEACAFYRNAISLIPQQVIDDAVAHYERVFWDWVKRYYQNRDLYVQVDLDALNQLKALEREEKEALGRPGCIAGTNVMVHNSVGEKLISANHGLLPELENDCGPFSLSKTDALTRAQRKKKLEQQLNDSTKNVKYFWSTLTYILLYSYEDCKEDFIDGTAEIWKDFDTGDPYEMAFAFMYLLDNGSDLPWCYFPCTTINCVSALKLPWTRRAFFPMDDGIFYHKDPITREPLLGPAEGTLPKRIKAPELEDWYELRYFDHEELCPERFNLAQIIYRITGCIMPRELNRYQPALKTLERFGITGKRMTHSLMYCMSLMGESTYRTDSSITPNDYTDEDEDFVDEGEYIEELEEQINALKEELKIEKQQAYESSREARNYQQRYETLAQVTANEAQELHDLRELIFRQQDGSYESLQPSKNISFPYSTDSRIIVFGGHESWVREIRKKLPTVRFIDRSAVPNANMIRKADAIWIQTNAMCHSQYYKVVDEAKKNNIPIRYFSFASPNKCAEQFIQEDKKASK